MSDLEVAQPPAKSESWYAILDAAVAEFAEHGRSGVRMEHVAKRAGYNKSLLYRYFSNRDTLFEAALARQFEGRQTMLANSPADFAQMLSWWSDSNRDNPLFMRMILREALDSSAAEPVAAEARQAYYQQQLAGLKGLQQHGQIAEPFAPDMLFLALLAVTILPTALPQICQLVTGLDPDSNEFKERWTEFLSTFTEQLAPK